MKKKIETWEEYWKNRPKFDVKQIIKEEYNNFIASQQKNERLEIKPRVDKYSDIYTMDYIDLLKTKKENQND